MGDLNRNRGALSRKEKASAAAGLLPEQKQFDSQRVDYTDDELFERERSDKDRESNIALQAFDVYLRNKATHPEAVEAANAFMARGGDTRMISVPIETLGMRPKYDNGNLAAIDVPTIAEQVRSGVPVALDGMAQRTKMAAASQPQEQMPSPEERDAIANRLMAEEQAKLWGTRPVANPNVPGTFAVRNPGAPPLKTYTTGPSQKNKARKVRR